MSQATRAQILNGYGCYNPGKLTRDQQADGLDQFMDGWRELAQTAERSRAALRPHEAAGAQAFGEVALSVLARQTRGARIAAFNAQLTPTTQPLVREQLEKLIRHEQAVGTLEREGVYDKTPPDPDRAKPDAALAREQNKLRNLIEKSDRNKKAILAHPETHALLDLMNRFPDQTEQLMTDPAAFPPPKGWAGRRMETLRMVVDSGPNAAFAKALRQARKKHPGFDTTVQTVLAPLITADRQLEAERQEARATVSRLEAAVADRRALEARVLTPDQYARSLALACVLDPTPMTNLARSLGMEEAARRLVRDHANWTERRSNLHAVDGLVTAIGSPPAHTAYSWLRPTLHKSPLQEFTPACFSAMGEWLQAGCNALRQIQTKIAMGQPAHVERLPPHPYFHRANEACPDSVKTILNNAKLMEDAVSRASSRFQICTPA